MDKTKVERSQEHIFFGKKEREQGRASNPQSQNHRDDSHLRPYFICGGSILSKWTVLTAAHCYCKSDTYPNYPPTKVRAGFLRWSKPWVGQTRQSKTVIVHPNYTENTYEHDLAIVVLETPFALGGPTPKAIRLPNPTRKVRPRDRLIVMGWGAKVVGAYDSNLESDELRKVELTVILPNQCGIEDPGYQFCAEGTLRKSGHCQGDSGGPLVSFSDTDTLLGVVSYEMTRYCAHGPGIYTHIPNSLYLDFIKKEGFKKGAPKPAELFTDPRPG
ncbi:unnamed protein product [Cyprideis torosa]|uniref:Uncharacterized protein n=1 Tax=Cyprideis torosa TaxID=163714 RepID=A0A7R8WTM8_9CRUS|nr:unnamed protein product [Cyprideis torosa]CAG0906015.1 unnamed protein product [Cyprideis torosa]